MDFNLDAAAGGLILTKFLPAGLGAGIMIAVDRPKTNQELFSRAFVALASSFLFTDFVFHILQTFSMFEWLNAANSSHMNAVAGIVGASGWFIMGGISVLLKKFKKAPLTTVTKIRDIAQGK